ncbi:MAG: EamA family transporter [Rhodobacterales bacterium]|nr:EamA family transporter [Rhodobacterales bacterium]
MEINNPRGILLMALGMALFAVADTIAKVLLEHYPPAQVVFLRQLGLFFGVNFIMLYNLKWVGKSQNLTKQLLRGLSATGSAVIFLFGLRTIPIADATAIAFVAPLFVIIFSYFILKEPIGIRRWLAVVIGFSGTLIIIRPGFEVIKVIKSLQIAHAVVVSPLQYTLLIWVTIFGFVIWGIFPDFWTFVGAGVIIATGLYSLHRERLKNRVEDNFS